MRTRREAIDLLNKCHCFPCVYTFKLIGENTPTFFCAVVSEVEEELGENISRRASFSSRESASGRYVAITLNMKAESAEQVIDLYQRFSKVEGLRSLM